MNQILPSSDLYWWGRFHNEFILEEYNNLYDENGILRPTVAIHNTISVTNGIDPSFPRIDIQTVRGELIRIPIIPFLENPIPEIPEPIEPTRQQAYIASHFESISIPFFE